MAEQTNYIPGMCNINPKEVAQRRRIGIIGLVAFIAVLTILIASDMERWYRVILFLPAFLAATGLLQAKNKFCVGFAGSDMHHADEGEVVKITDKKSISSDKKKARSINLQAAAYALLATIISLLLPTIS